VSHNSASLTTIVAVVHTNLIALRDKLLYETCLSMSE
jgi:hypothetical protein